MSGLGQEEMSGSRREPSFARLPMKAPRLRRSLWLIGAMLSVASLVACQGGHRPVATPPGVGVAPSIRVATSSGVGALPEPRAPFFDVTAYGAVSRGPAPANQAAINAAIGAASAAGGGTVLFPEGDYTTYTIRLQSRVGLHLASPKTVIRAAIAGTGAGKEGGQRGSGAARSTARNGGYVLQRGSGAARSTARNGGYVFG